MREVHIFDVQPAVRRHGNSGCTLTSGDLQDFRDRLAAGYVVRLEVWDDGEMDLAEAAKVFRTPEQLDRWASGPKRPARSLRTGTTWNSTSTEKGTPMTGRPIENESLLISEGDSWENEAGETISTRELPVGAVSAWLSARIGWTSWAEIEWYRICDDGPRASPAGFLDGGE